jgi:hypothetical protein
MPLPSYCYLQLSLFFHPEDAGIMLLQNVGRLLLNYEGESVNRLQMEVKQL